MSFEWSDRMRTGEAAISSQTFSKRDKDFPSDVFHLSLIQLLRLKVFHEGGKRKHGKRAYLLSSF